MVKKYNIQMQKENLSLKYQDANAFRNKFTATKNVSSSVPFKFRNKKTNDFKKKEFKSNRLKWKWLKKLEYRLLIGRNRTEKYTVKKTNLLNKWIRRFLTRIYFTRFVNASQKLTKVYIVSTYRNVIITITDGKNTVLHRVSAGSTKNSSFKKAMRKKPFPATCAGKEVGSFLKKNKLYKILIYLKGLGRGKTRRFVLKALEKSKLLIYGIKDVTAIPHNGCRKPKKRRL